MVPGNGSQLCTYGPMSLSDAKTISISIRRGRDGRSSSIVLPRDHHLARHLERLMNYDTPSPQPTQQPAGYDVVRALSSVVKYIHASNPRHEAPDSSIAALFSSLRPPSERVNVTEQHPPSKAEQPARHRRSSKGRTRHIKHCKVLRCGNISHRKGAESLKMILNDPEEDAVPMEIPRSASLPSLQDALRISQQSSMML